MTSLLIPVYMYNAAGMKGNIKTLQQLVQAIARDQCRIVVDLAAKGNVRSNQSVQANVTLV